MIWELFLIDPKKHKVVSTFVEKVKGVKDHLYKTVDTTVITKTGKKRTKNIPVFPGYFFVNVDENLVNETNSYLLENQYIKRFLGTLTEKEQLELNQLRDNDTYSKRFTESFREGDKVKIIDGLFKDYEATVISIKDSEILIETDLNGKPVRYSAKPDDISFVGRAMT